MTLQTIWNEKLIPEDQVQILPDNQSFRYGDGCFETMKMIHGNLLLKDYHFERLYHSLDQLKLKIPECLNCQNLLNQIKLLTEINNHKSFARIRLTIYRMGENFSKIGNDCGYIIQTMMGAESTNLYNTKGLRIGIYKDAVKSCDRFSSIKSNNYLPYIMAKIWASENNLDDALVCNSSGRIADSCIANIFIIENGIIKTPPLTEGCINGVMRRHLIDGLRLYGLPFKEEVLTIEQVLNAAEAFLTNAINGIRWIRKIEESEYSNDLSIIFYKQYINPLFQNKTI